MTDVLRFEQQSGPMLAEWTEEAGKLVPGVSSVWLAMPVLAFEEVEEGEPTT